MDSIKQTYTDVEYAYTTIPTYPSGQIGFIIAGKNSGSSKAPRREPTKEQVDSLKYYSSEIHEAAFVLPAFAKKGIFGAWGC